MFRNLEIQKFRNSQIQKFTNPEEKEYFISSSKIEYPNKKSTAERQAIWRQARIIYVSFWFVVSNRKRCGH
jgi:hypothetical protein